ncbi:MAG: PAS domain-containing protein [Azospirillum sp.]|nr:PAS domain-containing protein [Azospirillum sp.]
MYRSTEPVPPRRNRFGIRRKLAAAFLMVAAMAMASAAVAWLAFREVESGLAWLTTDVVPTLVSAQAMAIEADRVVAMTASLATVASDEERRHLTRSLQGAAGNLTARLAELRAAGVAPPAVGRLGGQVSAFAANLARQDTLVGQRLAQSRVLEDAETRLAEDHRGFLDAVSPRIDDAYRFLYRSSRRLIDGLSSTVSVFADLHEPDQMRRHAEMTLQETRLAVGSLLNNGVREMRSLLELAATSNLAVSLLHQTADAKSAESLRDLRERFTRSTAVMGMIRLNLASTPANRTLLERARLLWDAGLGRSNLFDQRAAILVTVAQCADLTEKTRRLSAELHGAVTALVEQARTAANRAALEARSRLTMAQLVQIAAGLAAIVVALLSAWLYVGRKLVARLLALERCMEAQAAGIDAPVPPDGDDEITDMAAALRSLVFERERRERALRASEQRLTQALKATRSGVFDHDIAHKRFWWSPEYYAVLGYRPEDLPAGREFWRSTVHPDDRERVVSEFREVVAGGLAEGTIAYRARHRDGYWLWVEDQGAVIRDDGGAVVRCVGVTSDITERKEAESRLRDAKEAAEQANAAKTRFVATASHDLRQPLQAVTLFNSALADLTSDPQQLYLVEKTQKSLEIVNELLNGILDISRLDAGIVVPQSKCFAIQTLFDRLTFEFRPQARAAGLAFRFVECRALVLSDPQLVERILRNLVSNALRYTSRGGILLGCRPRGGELVVQVCDSGIGIPADQSAAIFEEFYQIGDQGHDGGRGLGLGLAICRRLAELLGCRLSFRSRLGRGTTFEIALPCHRGPLPEGAVAEPALAGHATGRIAVIEDDPSVREALAFFLDRNGFEVTAAADVDTALAQLRAHGVAPDLILADYRLAKGDTGIDAIERLRTAFCAPIPGILLTGDTSPQRLKEVLASGFRLLHKPIRPNELILAIAERLGGAGPATP